MARAKYGRCKCVGKLENLIYDLSIYDLCSFCCVFTFFVFALLSLIQDLGRNENSGSR